MMPSIENRGQTDLDLDFQSPASYGHDHIHAKHLRSTISSLEWKDSVGRTDGHDRLQYIGLLHTVYTFPANAITNSPHINCTWA